MRIEKLKTTPDRAGRYWITLDNGEKLALYRQTVEDFALYTGKELSNEEWEALQESAGKMSARMRAVRIVTASAVSKRDLQERLVRKGEDPTQAREAVDWMESLSLVDDRKTAEHVVENCIRKGYGLSRAKQALYEKRIPKELWDDVLADYPDQIDKITGYLSARLTDPEDEKQVRRAIDALIRRGHRYADIRHALSNLSIDQDQFPEE